MARFNESHEEVVRQRDQLLKEKHDLEQRYNAALGNRDKILKEYNDTKQTLTRVQQQRDEYMIEMNQVVSARLKATKDLSRMTEERNFAVQEYNLIMSERDTVHKEIEKLQEELSDAQKNVAILQEEKKANLEQIDSLKREMASIIIDRDKTAKKYREIKEKCEYRDDAPSPTSPIRLVSSHNHWDSCSSGISSSWKQSSLLSNLSQHHWKTSGSKLDNIEQLNIELDSLRRINEQIHQELFDGQHELEALKKERDWAFNDRDKVVMERESIKALCDRLRRERDRVVNDLAEALKDSDDMKRQRNEAEKELKELKEKFDAQFEKSCSIPSKEPSSLSLSLPTRDQQSSTPPPPPTLLDRAYNQIFGDRKHSHLHNTSQEENETIAQFDRVLDNYSSNKNYANKTMKQKNKKEKIKEKEKNGGTWPKYRGTQVPIVPNGNESNTGLSVLHSMRRKERKLNTIVSPADKMTDILSPITQYALTTKTNSPKEKLLSNYSIYETNTDICEYRSHHRTPSSYNSSTHQMNLKDSKLTSSAFPQDSQEKSIDKIDLKFFRSRSGKGESIDYSVVSAQTPENNLVEYYKNRSTKARPHSVHDVLHDVLDNTSYHITSEKTYNGYLGKSIMPMSAARSGESFDSSNHLKRNLYPHQTHIHNPNSNLRSVPQPPERCSSTSPRSVLVAYTRNGENESKYLHDHSHVRSLSVYQPNFTTKLLTNRDNNRYNITPSPSPSTGSNVYSNSKVSQNIDTYHKRLSSTSNSHSNQASNASGYKSDENEAGLVSSYDGLSTFPKRSQRIRIPSNQSVTSKSSGGKLSTESIDKKSLSDRYSPVYFNVEWISPPRSNKDPKSYKPKPGDSRHIEIMRSSEPLGINISCNKPDARGVFVSSVEISSLASQAGIQVGDQVLEICGINMRNATFDHAANVLRQCGDRLSLLLQYNPAKMRLDRSSYEERDEDEDDEITSNLSLSADALREKLNERNKLLKRI